MKILTPGWRMMLCGAALVVAGCAMRVQTIYPVATIAHPRVVELFITTMIQPRTHFIADGTFVACEEYPPEPHYTGRYDDHPTAQVRKQPTPAQWARFWRTVDRLRLPAWKPEYAQSDLPPGKTGEHIYTTDGAQWKTRYSTPGHRQDATGDGAFPTVGQPARTTTAVLPASRNGVLALEDAFEELLK